MFSKREHSDRRLASGYTMISFRPNVQPAVEAEILSLRGTHEELFLHERRSSFVAPGVL